VGQKDGRHPFRAVPVRLAASAVAEWWSPAGVGPGGVRKNAYMGPVQTDSIPAQPRRYESVSTISGVNDGVRMVFSC
jgi:hypothetical protein